MASVALQLSLVFLAMCGAQGGGTERAEDDMEQLGFEEENHKLSPEETARLLTKHFNEIDTDGDGKIDYTELDRRFHDHMDRHFKMLGEIHEGKKREDFAKADANSDGTLSKEELAAVPDEEGGHDESAIKEFDFFDGDKDSRMDYQE
jgi:hypothetical protein